MKELKKTDEAKHKDICTKVREDGAYVEAGENDNLLVQKVSRRPRHDRGPRLQLPEKMPTRLPVQLAGVTPTEETIANPTYPGSRKLYVYVKGEHDRQAVDEEFHRGLLEGAGTGGKLEKRGLVPFGGADAEAATAQAAALTAGSTRQRSRNRRRRANDAHSRSSPSCSWR